MPEEAGKPPEDLSDDHRDPHPDPLEGGVSEDPPPPPSPWRRRTATIVAIVFMVGIVTFLVWFMATHTERAEGGGFFGRMNAGEGFLRVA